MECKKEQNLKHCNCTYSCANKGVCCECVSYHRSRNELPACYFPDSAESTYDRTFRHFVDLYNNNKL